jgi:hypothetical protein
MDQEFRPVFELLQRRLALMRQLAVSLELVQSAVVHSDRSAIDGYSAEQRGICEALRQIEIEACGRTLHSPLGSGSSEQKNRVRLPEGAVSPQLQQSWQALSNELSEVELRVSQLNRVYGALLRRAQRTLEIFMRVLANSANTYAPPKCAATIAPSTMQDLSHV